MLTKRKHGTRDLLHRTRFSHRVSTCAWSWARRHRAFSFGLQEKETALNRNLSNLDAAPGNDQPHQSRRSRHPQGCRFGNGRGLRSGQKVRTKNPGVENRAHNRRKSQRRRGDLPRGHEAYAGGRRGDGDRSREIRIISKESGSDDIISWCEGKRDDRIEEPLSCRGRGGHR